MVITPGTIGGAILFFLVDIVLVIEIILDVAFLGTKPGIFLLLLTTPFIEVFSNYIHKKYKEKLDINVLLLGILLFLLSFLLVLYRFPLT